MPRSSDSRRPHRTRPGLPYHGEAYPFVFAALQFTQDRLGRDVSQVFEEHEAHVSGRELCEGVRDLAAERFGLLARTVLEQWGLHTTEDVGRVVFALVEEGELRADPSDTPADFASLFDLGDALEREDRMDLAALRD